MIETNPYQHGTPGWAFLTSSTLVRLRSWLKSPWHPIKWRSLFRVYTISSFLSLMSTKTWQKDRGCSQNTFTDLGFTILWSTAQQESYMQCIATFDSKVQMVQWLHMHTKHSWLNWTLYTNIFLLDFNYYLHLTSAADTTWFKSLWGYANHIWIQIVMRSDFCLNPVCVGDGLLMDCFCGWWTQQQEL